MNFVIIINTIIINIIIFNKQFIALSDIQVDLKINDVDLFLNQITGYKHLNEIYLKESSGLVFKTGDVNSVLSTATKSLHKLFSDRKEALLASLKHTEDLTRKFSYDPSLTDVKYVDVSSLNDVNEFNESYVLLDYEISSVKIVQALFLNSTVYIPIDIYNKENDILNNIDWTKDIDSIWSKNSEDSKKTIKWQYYGSKSGLFRFYPGYAVVKESPDLFDVRRQQWYIQGISSPKNMLILVDNSGSSHGQALALIKHSITSLFETLGENDFVNVGNFSKSTNMSFPTFVQATYKNKQKLLKYVNSIVASGIANFSKGLEDAFMFFENFTAEDTDLNYNGAKCNNVIALFTDGGTETAQEIIEKYNADKKIRIFTYVIGPITGATPALKWIGCTNRGYFYQIPSMVAIRSKVQDYLSYMGKPNPTPNTPAIIETSPFKSAIKIEMCLCV